MGFFSWITQDTNRSIPSKHSSRPTFVVFMKDDKGNVWQENNYDGFGVFGGKDYYELLAEMNGYDSNREKGIQLELGVSGIQNKETNKILLSDGIDFFNWNNDILKDNKSANELVDSGRWVVVNVKQTNIKFPNLVQNEYETWVNLKPITCPHQGFFY